MVTQHFVPDTGGIQTYALEVASRLAPRCAAFHLVCPGSPAGSRDAQLPFPVHRLRCGSDATPIVAAPMVARLVRNERIDTVFHVEWQTAPIGALLRRISRIETLAIAVHGKELLLRPLARLAAAQHAYDQFRARVLEAADVLLPVSHFAAELAARIVGRHRIAVVPNGVHAAAIDGGDARSFRSRHGLGDDRILLTVGRLVPRKGIDAVIECLPRLLSEHPRVRYLVVGAGPDEPRLRAMIDRHGLRAHVRMLGRLDHAELAACYAACDVFVLAGRDEPDSVEGFGLVLLEAGACGRPTVTTEAGGMGEAVKHGVTGLVVPAGDAHALVTAISALLRDPAFARQLGDGGRRHAYSEGSWDRAAQGIWDALTRTSRQPETVPDART